MCLITRGDRTVDVIAMGRRGDEDMQIFRHSEFVSHGSSGGLMTSQFTRERQSTAEGRIALGSKKIHFSRRSRVFANSEGREKRGKGGEKEGKEEKREGRRITVAVKLMMVLMRYL